MLMTLTATAKGSLCGWSNDNADLSTARGRARDCARSLLLTGWKSQGVVHTAIVNCQAAPAQPNFRLS